MRPPAPDPRPPVRTACVLTHGRPEVIGDGLRRLARVAAEHGVALRVPPGELAKHPDDAGVLEVGDCDAPDLAIVLGGDGTTLRALQRFLGSDVPVLAINYGRVGFLTTAEHADLEPVATRAFRGEYRVEELPVLAVSAQGTEVGRAVNDVVVTSDVHGRMAIFGWQVNGVDLGEVGCDAMVIATPTGSTAYSLSAGGPVLNWGLDAACVTFASPHVLAIRSLVLPRGHRISARNAAPDVSARVVLDGHVEPAHLPAGASIEVELAPERARLALLPEVSFLQRYRETFTQ